MANAQDYISEVDTFFSGSYEVTEGRKVPDVSDIKFGKYGTQVDLAMLFIDLRESTRIVDGFRRETAAKMYKSFIWGVAKIARANGGELRSFNGDGILMAFYGDMPCTHAAKAAMQMSWFVLKVLKPKLDKYFADNKELEDIDFGYGIGIDYGKVLVVRGGFRGENNNDLVWVGNATNYAVKLSALGKNPHNIYISKTVYDRLHDSRKFTSDGKVNMWEQRSWTAMNNQTIYRSSYYSSIS